MITDDDADRLIAANPGVQGLAQLGRNAIERVIELERELAALKQVISDQRNVIDETHHAFCRACDDKDRIADERDAANAYASELNDSLIAANAEAVALEAERNQLRAHLAAIAAAPVVAWASADLRSVFVDDELAAKCTDVRELIARPAKE